MNLVRLADIETQISRLEASLDVSTLNNTQKEYVYKQINKLENEKDKLLADKRGLGKMPWYDEHY